MKIDEGVEVGDPWDSREIEKELSQIDDRLDRIEKKLDRLLSKGRQVHNNEFIPLPST